MSVAASAGLNSALTAHWQATGAIEDPGSPLCEAATHDPKFDGFEVALKGGQAETANEVADYFGIVRDGRAPPAD